MPKKNLQQGQTIIEVLIATVVVAMVLVAVAGGLTLSLKNTSETKLRSFATNYAQEALEVYRKEKTQQGWATFSDRVATGTYCLNELPADTEEFNNLTTGACTSGTAIAGTTLTRTSYVDILSADEIRVEIEVTWTDALDSREVVVVQEFKNTNL